MFHPIFMVLNPIFYNVSPKIQFMKNDNFRRPIVENEVQNHENGSGCMQQSSLCPILHFVDFDWEKCIKMAWVAHT